MLGRREVLLGALGVVSLSACDVDDLRPPEDEPAPSAGAPPSASASAASDPDTVLLDRVTTEIIRGVVVVDGARLLPRLRGALGPLRRMHLAHLKVLDAGFEDAIPERPLSVPAALQAVRTAEVTLQAALAAAAVEAESGVLARLLASMSAAVSQQLAVLPTDPAPGPSEEPSP